ncbi:MAG: ferrous iron transport protein A [Planctomycetes bacterium]|nr:ferrous iron transport protein A [Planctomycetota bacterium]
MTGGCRVYELIPLDCVLPGRTAEVEQLVGCAEHVRRLEEMGVRRGTVVEVLRCGKPCIVRVGCNRLCFRCSDLLSVLVRDTHTGGSPSE